MCCWLKSNDAGQTLWAAINCDVLVILLGRKINRCNVAWFQQNEWTKCDSPSVHQKFFKVKRDFFKQRKPINDSSAASDRKQMEKPPLRPERKHVLDRFQNMHKLVPTFHFTTGNSQSNMSDNIYFPWLSSRIHGWTKFLSLNPA